MGTFSLERRDFPNPFTPLVSYDILWYNVREARSRQCIFVWTCGKSRFLLRHFIWIFSHHVEQRGEFLLQVKYSRFGWVLTFSKNEIPNISKSIWHKVQVKIRYVDTTEACLNWNFQHFSRLLTLVMIVYHRKARLRGVKSM